MSTGEDTFAAALRRLRGDLSLRELGRRASCSKSLISDLEHERRQPTLRVAESLDKALGARGRLVALARGDSIPLDPQQNDAEGHQPGPLGDLLQEWDDELRRRRFLISSGAVAGAAITTGLATDDAQGGRELLAAHAALRAAHGRLDNLRGASSVYQQAVENHRQIVTWQTTATSRAERRQIAALAADTGGFVGFLMYDLGMPDAAADQYRQAAAHAHEADDLSSCANLVGQMSRILADQGKYAKALALTNRALQIATTRAHPAVRSWLHAVRAHHHACLGNIRASQNDLTTAWALLGRADDGEIPPYIGYLSAAELGKWEGHAMTKLAESRPALVRTGRAALDEARATWPTAMVRGSAEVLTASARAYVASGEPEEATRLLGQAITVATTTGSARNLRAALNVVTAHQPQTRGSA